MITEARPAPKTIYEKKNHIAYLTINYPEKANILSKQVIEEMGEARLSR
jgi:enoyl-CoA hydratase/carnithine racemase